MQDRPNPTIPTVEPPPHPNEEPKAALRENSGFVNQGQKNPTELKDTQGYQIRVEQVSPEEAKASQLHQKDTEKLLRPKKGFPKKIFLVIFLIFILLGVVSLVVYLAKSRGTLFGTEGELVWWGIQHEEGIYKSLIDDFEKENPKIKVTYQQLSPQDYRVRLTNSLAAGNGPDIFEIHSSWPFMFKNELSSLPPSVMSQEEFKNSFYPIFVKDLTLPEKGIIAMPLEYDALTLFVNEDIFASSLQSAPTTWDELVKKVDPGEKGSLTIKETGGKITLSGIALGETENVDHWPEIIALMLFQNRVNPAQPVNDLTEDVFSFYKEFKTLGVWNTSFPSSTIAFTRGEVAMYIGPSRRAKEIFKENPTLAFKTELLPQLPKGNPSDPNYSYATYWVHGVWERSKNKEAAWKFLKFLAERENLEKLNQNIKNVEGFSRVYPRPEMNIVFRDDTILGSVASLALDAKSWYLADNTFDGATGVNSQLKMAFEEVLGKWPQGKGTKMKELGQGVSSVLSQYGIPLK